MSNHHINRHFFLQGLCDKYFTDAELLARVPNMFYMLGGIFCVMGLLATLLVSDPDQATTQSQVSTVEHPKIALG